MPPRSFTSTRAALPSPQTSSKLAGSVMVVRAWSGLGDKLGHRGRFLLFLVFLDCASGYRLAWPDPQTANSASTIYLTGIAPLWVWSVGWFAVAAVCLWKAFQVNDALAFGCAMVLKFAWAAIYLLGWLVHSLPQGYFSVAVWAFAALVVHDISTWQEPTRHPAQTDGDS